MSRNRLMGTTLSVVVSSLVLVGSAVAIPNPAVVFCLEMGYVVEDDCCVFPDGTSCGLWAFLRGECGEEYLHPVPCAEAGERRGVAVECCEGLVEISGGCIVDHACQPLIGSFALCSACGDGVCDEWENPCNCPEDCGACVEEGGTIPAVFDPPVCCAGLRLIPPKQADWYGIHGYCTANCGDGECDPAIESDYNCPEDCADDYFAGCGVLEHGPKRCTVLHADTGELFVVPSTGEFRIGDRVYMTGWVVGESLLVAADSVLVIEDYTISACRPVFEKIPAKGLAIKTR